MNDRRLFKTLLLTSTAILLVPLTALTTRADDDDGGGRERGRKKARAPRLAPAAMPAYVEECGSCHLAYPPGLLPARSWTRVMAELSSHFGQNAEVDAETAKVLSRWLTDHAAESGSFRRSEKVLRRLGERDVPTRITELPYYRKKHDEVPATAFSLPAVLTPANCSACHPRAEQWVFDDDSARIPR